MRRSHAMNLIQQENARPGALDWQLTRMRLDKSEGIRSSFIEGFCSRQSVKAGESLDIFVSTKPAARFKIEIFRTGWYGGRGARLMTELGAFDGIEQSVPEVGDRRLRECKWAKTTSLTIPSDWLSGVYLGRLTTLPATPDEPYWQDYIVFIVRDDRQADILLQCSDNTWQAYNRWPDTFSLYDDGISPGMVSPPGIDISFDRPYGKYRQIYENPQSIGSGEWLCFEFPLAFWLEQHGYDVSYCSNSDMLTPERGLKSKTWISAGHDEYWDVRQYHSVAAMRDAGVSILFLSGNAVCWVSPFRNSSSGAPNRIITRDAPYGGLARQKFNDLAHFEGHTTGPDEGLLMGAINVIPVNGGGDWTCAMPDHWIFEGTGMKKGESVPGMVGWEYHGDPAPIPGLEIVATGETQSAPDTPNGGVYTGTVYPGPKGNFVFNASTCWWSDGLSAPPGYQSPSVYTTPKGVDHRVQQITRNIVERMIRG